MKEPAATAFVVLTTFPDVATARSIGDQLLDERLVACISLLPVAESRYVWKSERQTAAEVPALLKTTAEAYPRLEARLHELHPYEVPEILVLPIARGLPEYLAWIAENCDP